MLTSLIARFVGLPAWARQALAIAAAVLALTGSAALWLHYHDRAVIEHHEAKKQAAIATSAATAAAERVDDAIRNTANEKDLHHAIDTAPSGGSISPADHALACERLRKLGRVPAACRAEGGH